ncbi:NAD-dependent epimerase/dehydratase family protein [Falsihalocynthiibacter sp. SS001]|uniref:NAD-dependent epimerase/dehydratase family protein n=1 Tax=Falsihalocynthiibacter sp. SS001 TaxID=3349698 RepID=UPI0036D25408
MVSDVVIFGGSGFIGRNLAAALADSGKRVTAISRRPLPLSHENITSVKADFGDVSTYERYIREGHTVVQLVNGINPRTGNGQLLHDIEHEVFPHIRFLELCASRGVCRVIFASSGGAVYGNAPIVPTSEEVVPTPQNSYGVVKLMIEKYYDLFHLTHDLDFVTLRLSNPYGPSQEYRSAQNFLIPSIIEKLQHDQEMTIYGDGEDARDFVYIDDVVAAFCSAIERQALFHRLLNIGGGGCLTINAIVSEIEAVAGRNIRRKYIEGDGSSVRQSHLDISLAAKELGWKPQIGLRPGLIQTLRGEGFTQFNQ